MFFERGKHFSITPEGEVFRDAAREIIETYRGDRRRCLRELQNIAAGPLVDRHHLDAGLARAAAVSLQALQGALSRRGGRGRLSAHAAGVCGDHGGQADSGWSRIREAARMVAEEFAKDELVHGSAPRTIPCGAKSAARRNCGARISFCLMTCRRARRSDRLKEAALLAAKMEFDNIETVKRAVEVENGVSIAGCARPSRRRSPTGTAGDPVRAATCGARSASSANASAR
ncbi:MAG: hypothetical protein R3F11_24785 [Verrucomicrobiales bacterium]